MLRVLDGCMCNVSDMTVGNLKFSIEAKRWKLCNKAKSYLTNMRLYPLTKTQKLGGLNRFIRHSNPEIQIKVCDSIWIKNVTKIWIQDADLNRSVAFTISIKLAPHHHILFRKRGTNSILIFVIENVWPTLSLCLSFVWFGTASAAMLPRTQIDARATCLWDTSSLGL